MPPLPPMRRRPTLSSRLLRSSFIAVFSAFALFALGVLTGYWFAGSRRSTSDAATAQLTQALSKPLSVHVDVTNSTSQSTGSTLLETLSGLAADTIRDTEKHVTDKAEIASDAAHEFITKLSGEAGEKVVDGFSDLIASGFKPSGDKDKDRQVVTNILVGDFLPAAQPTNPVQALSPRLEARVLFGINKAGLTPPANDTIGRVRDFALRHPAAIILLTANADTLGSERGNRDLAGRRSKAVLQRLVSFGGIAANRVFVADLGNVSLPVVTPPRAAEEQNRSVSIEVRE
jgi:outer membrane protein OmpA-like peptidoglycan-associated protein